MYSLNIPTVETLSLVLTDDSVQRDPFYKHQTIEEKCAIVCRVAKNFFRFGSLEICLNPEKTGSIGGPSEGQEKYMIPFFLDYVISNYYTQIENNPEKYFCFIKELTYRTAKLVA